MSHSMKPPASVAQLTLSESLLRRAHALTPDLDRQVAQLLSAWVKVEGRRQIDQGIDASDAYVAKHGLPGAEYSPV